MTDLPVEVIEKIKKTLCCFTQCHVEKRGDKFEVSPHSYLSSEYSSEFIGTFVPSDLMTIEEWREGYEAEFGEKPRNDYGWS